MTDKLLHNLVEASQLLGGMSRATIYEHISRGELQAVKVGRRTYIAHEELLRFVSSLRVVPNGQQSM